MLIARNVEGIYSNITSDVAAANQITAFSRGQYEDYLVKLNIPSTDYRIL